MQREQVAAELVAIHKTIDTLKHGRPSCQSAREKCAEPAEQSIVALLKAIGYEYAPATHELKDLAEQPEAEQPAASEPTTNPAEK